MRSIGATRNYRDRGPKDHWRRSIWNEILRRTAGREHREPILYLPGPQDLDRVVAMRKGVRGQNLIAIDIDKQNAERVRRGLRPSIHSDVLRVIKAWPADRPVAAVLLDLCGGYDKKTEDILNEVYLGAAFENSVIGFNLMRGRDPWSNPFRTFLAGFGMSNSSRPYQLLTARCLHARIGIDWKMGDEVPTAADLSDDRARYSPRYFSYRSGRLVFDSVVTLNPCRDDRREYADENRDHERRIADLHRFGKDDLAIEMLDIHNERLALQAKIDAATRKSRESKAQCSRSDRKADPLVVRKIAATLAVRTARLAGVLPVSDM